MNDSTAVTIDRERLVDLAILVWRLDLWLNQQQNLNSPTVPRYVLRGLNKILSDAEVNALDNTGQAFDAGLAYDVVDSVEVDSLSAGDTIIGQTVAPIVSIGGTVVRHGQIVLHVGKERAAAGVEDNG